MTAISWDNFFPNTAQAAYWKDRHDELLKENQQFLLRAHFLEQAVKQAEEWFDEYAEMHLAKPYSSLEEQRKNLEKVAANRSKRDYFRRALQP